MISRSSVAGASRSQLMFRGMAKPIPSIGYGRQLRADAETVGKKHKAERRETPAGAGMNPRETQAGGSARDHLSAIEAHIKGRPLDSAFPDYSGCVDPPVSPRGLVRKVTEN